MKKIFLFLMTLMTSVHGINGQLRPSKPKEKKPNIKIKTSNEECVICWDKKQEYPKKQFTSTSCIFCNGIDVCTDCNDSFGIKCPTCNLDSLYRLNKSGSMIPGNLARLIATKHRFRPNYNNPKNLKRLVFCLATELHEIQEKNNKQYQTLVKSVKEKEKTKLEKQVMIKAIDNYKNLQKNIRILDLGTKIGTEIFGCIINLYTFYSAYTIYTYDPLKLGMSCKLPLDYYLH